MVGVDLKRRAEQPLGVGEIALARTREQLTEVEENLFASNHTRLGQGRSLELPDAEVQQGENVVLHVELQLVLEGLVVRREGASERFFHRLSGPEQPEERASCPSRSGLPISR